MSVHQKNCFLQLDFTTQDIAIHSHPTDSVKIGNKQLKYKQEGNIKRLFVYKDNPLRLEVEHFIKSVKSGKKSLQPEQDIIALEIAIEIEKMLSDENSNYSRDRVTTHRSL